MLIVSSTRRLCNPEEFLRGGGKFMEEIRKARRWTWKRKAYSKYSRFKCWVALLWQRGIVFCYPSESCTCEEFSGKRTRVKYPVQIFPTKQSSAKHHNSRMVHVEHFVFMLHMLNIEFKGWVYQTGKKYECAFNMSHRPSRTSLLLGYSRTWAINPFKSLYTGIDIQEELSWLDFLNLRSEAIWGILCASCQKISIYRVH